MRTRRLPTREELERRIPHCFFIAWIVCGTAVFVEAIASRGSLFGSDGAAARVTHAAAAGAALGYLAAGVVVSVLSVLHSWASRRNGDASEATSRDAAAGRPAPSTGTLSEPRLRLFYLLFLLAAAAALGVDCSVAQWRLVDKCPGLVHDFLASCAEFGQWEAMLVVLLAIHQLDPPRRRMLWWPLACAMLSGMAANGAKMFLARTRPYAFDFHGGVWTTFGQWLPAAADRQSFPSGHAATAMGLALALAAMYPRGRRFFLFLAVLVACQRIECGAHYLSDVLCGAAIGCLTAACSWRLASWRSIEL